MVQDAVGRFVDDKVLPIIGDCFDQARFPAELIPEIAGLGLLGATIPEEYGGAGMNRRQLRPDLPGTGARRFGPAQLRLGAELAVHVSDLRLRQRGAENAVPAGDGARRGDRLLRPDRAARRLRPGQHEDRCEEGRRRLGASTAPRCGSPTAISRTSPIVWAQTDDGIQGFVVPTDTKGFKAQEMHKKMSLRASVTSRAVLRRRARAGQRAAAEREGSQGTARLPDPGALRHHAGVRSAPRRPA